MPCEKHQCKNVVKEMLRQRANEQTSRHILEIDKLDVALPIVNIVVAIPADSGIHLVIYPRGGDVEA